MPIPRCTASWCSCRCRSTSIRRACSQAVSPAKDVDGFHAESLGALVAGAPRLRALHARRRDAHARARAGAARRPPRGGDRPLQHRRQAARAAALAKGRHRHHLPLEDPRISARSTRQADVLVAAIGRPKLVTAQHGQTRRLRDRRRHQPAAPTARSPATSISPRSRTSPAGLPRCPAGSVR